MTAPTVERFGPDVSIGSLLEAIERDGVAMVEDAIDPGLLTALNGEFDVTRGPYAGAEQAGGGSVWVLRKIPEDAPTSSATP